MPIRRPADLFAGKGSVAGKLKKKRKAVEAGDATGGRKSKKNTKNASKDAAANEKAIKEARAKRKAKGKKKVKGRKSRRDLTMRGQ